MRWPVVSSKTGRPGGSGKADRHGGPGGRGGSGLHKRRRLDRLTVSALVLSGILVAAGVAGQLSLFGDPRRIGTTGRLGAPTAGAPFGTDELGRSMLPRVAEAIGNTLVLALVAVVLSTIVAIVVAVPAGYLKGSTDRIVVASADILFSFPALLFAILIAAVLGPGQAAAVAAIILVTLPRMVRVFRQAVMVVAEREFVVNAEISGLPVWRIMGAHVVPNIAGPIAVQATFALSVAMLVESGLSFLGLGIQPPSASLGSLVAGGLNALALAPWLVFIPSAVLVAAIVAANLIGDGLRDLFEPRDVRSLR
jgi:peptide/nickel transport system permease protein